MSSREDTPEPGTSSANTSQVAPAAPQDNSQENGACPECWDINTVCSSSCRHCFCRLCLWDWSLGEAVCPRCQRPTRHPYPQHVALYHEVQQRVYDGKRRCCGHSAGQPQSCAGHFRRFGPRERRRRRSVRWASDGRGSDSPRRRWWQRRRAWEDAPREGRALRFEWDVPDSSRPRTRRRLRRSWSQQERSRGRCRWNRGRQRSRGRDRQQGRFSRRGQDSHSRSVGQRRWRSWNAHDRHTPRSQHDTPLESSEPHEREDSHSSGQQHTTRSRTRGRSHRRGHSSQAGFQGMVPRDRSAGQRRWRSCNADDRHTPRYRYDTSLGRSETHQWEDWDSSRQQHATGNQTRGRSQRRGQDTERSSEETVRHSQFARQRQWRSWNPDQAQAPRSQRDIPGSSGRNSHRRRSRSHAGHRDT